MANGRGVAGGVNAATPPVRWPQVLTVMPTELTGIEERPSGVLAMNLKDGRSVVLHPSVTRLVVWYVQKKQEQRSQHEGLRDVPGSSDHDPKPPAEVGPASLSWWPSPFLAVGLLLVIIGAAWGEAIRAALALRGGW